MHYKSTHLYIVTSLFFRVTPCCELFARFSSVGSGGQSDYHLLFPVHNLLGLRNVSSAYYQYIKKLHGLTVASSVFLLSSSKLLRLF